MRLNPGITRPRGDRKNTVRCNAIKVVSDPEKAATVLLAISALRKSTKAFPHPLFCSARKFYETYKFYHSCIRVYVYAFGNLFRSSPNVCTTNVLRGVNESVVNCQEPKLCKKVFSRGTPEKGRKIHPFCC